MAKETEQLKKAYREFIIDCITNEIKNSDAPEELHSDEVMEILKNDPDLQTLRQLVTSLYPDETRYHMQLTQLEDASEEGFSQEFTDLLDDRVQKWSEAEREKKAEQEMQMKAELKESYYRFIAYQMHLTEKTGDYEDFPEERHYNVEDLKALTDLESLQGYAVTNFASEIENLPYPENLSDEELQLMSETERLNVRINNWFYTIGIDLERPDLEIEDQKYQRYVYEKNYKPEVKEMSDEEKEQIQTWLAEQEKKQREAEIQAEKARAGSVEADIEPEFGEADIEPEFKQPEQNIPVQKTDSNEEINQEQPEEKKEEPEFKETAPEENLEEDDDELSPEKFEKLQPRRRSNSFDAQKVDLSMDDEKKGFKLADVLSEEDLEPSVREEQSLNQPEKNIPVQKTDSNEEINHDEPEEPKLVNEAIYNQALRELNSDLDKTKSIFSSDSKVFTRIKTYMTEISKLKPLDRDQLRQVFNLLRTSVEDYQEHAKNNPRPQDNWRRNTRLGIMDKIAALADDFDNQVYNPKGEYGKRATESMIEAMCKKNPNVNRDKFAEAFTEMSAYKNTINELSIYELDKIANDPKAAAKLTINIYERQEKINSKSPQAENKVPNEMNKLLK